MTTVKLGIDQSAEPNKCGSCHYFKHRQVNYDTMGLCSFKLPPWVDKMYRDDNRMWEVDPHTVQDINTCSFYTPKKESGVPVTFVQERRWPAGTESK